MREGPIINDATIEDARRANIPDFAELITTGSHGPGTLLGDATQILIDALKKADLIISKSQGNFESLSSDPLLQAMPKPGTPIFFLLTVKCGIVGQYAGVEEGLVELILEKGNGKRCGGRTVEEIIKIIRNTIDIMFLDTKIQVSLWIS